MEIIYAMQPVTAENLHELKRIHAPEDLMCSPKNIPFKVGVVLVERRIHINDPFETSMKTVQKSVWLTNRARLREAFNYDTDPRRYNDFQIITPKQDL